MKKLKKKIKAIDNKVSHELYFLRKTINELEHKIQCLNHQLKAK